MVRKGRAGKSGHSPTYVFTVSLVSFSVDDLNWVAKRLLGPVSNDFVGLVDGW